MSKKAAPRNYTLTDSGLIIYANHLLQVMTRDSEEFSHFSIGTAEIDALQSLCSDFEEFPIDDIFIQNLMLATQAKDNLRKLVLQSSRNIAVRAKVKFGAHSPIYKKFNTLRMNSLEDNKLLLLSREIYEAGLEFLTQLESVGLSISILDDFNVLCQDFENSLIEAREKMELRDMKTDERVILGNQLYSLVSNYSLLGKQIWRGIDEAKYNDYIIYGNVPSPAVPGKIQGLNYNPMLTKFSWQADIAATSYEVQRTTDGAWSQIYAGPSPELVIEPVPGAAQVRCRGINDAGSGAWSDVLDYMIQLGTPHITSCVFQSAEIRVAISWDVVDYASSYLVYQSEVPIGQPAGEYLVLGQPTGTTYYFDSPTMNMREYYYIVAEYAAGGMESQPSNTVSVDIPVV